jgi:serine/threonine-protein kinase HipA
MATTPNLTVFLGATEVGSITQLPGDRYLFIFAEDYIHDAKRPILSLSYKDNFGGLLTDNKPTQTRLPAFFSNLLPEGKMRDYLARQAGVKSQREFFLLQALGDDLPGAIRVNGHNQESSADEAISAHAMHQDEVLRFSLAGIQLKFSAIAHARGGLTIPANGIGGDWIVKLPDQQFAGVPENEFAMMALAQQIGIDVPETKLLPIDKIHGLPDNMTLAGQVAYAIRRFDRDAAGQRIHIEDFAQIFNLYPEQKYDRASYQNLAKVIWLETGEQGIVEFIRRLVFNILIGNGDMHSKNWSLIYRDGHTPSLAPAYDFVSTIPYIDSDDLALNIAGSKNFADVDDALLRRFAAKVGLPQRLIRMTAAETVELFHQAWREVGHLGLADNIRASIARHLKTLAL